MVRSGEIISLFDIIQENEDELLRRFGHKEVFMRKKDRDEDVNYYRQNGYGYTTRDDAGVWSFQDAFDQKKDYIPSTNLLFEFL